MSTSALNSASDSSPTSARLSITWISEPSPSRSRAKQSLPVLRWKMTRPVIATCSPVRVSGSSSPRSSFGSHVSRISRIVWRALDRDRVGLSPRVQHPLPLVPAYPDLLGHVVARRRVSEGWGLGPWSIHGAQGYFACPS